MLSQASIPEPFQRLFLRAPALESRATFLDPCRRFAHPALLLAECLGERVGVLLGRRQILDPDRTELQVCSSLVMAAQLGFQRPGAGLFMLEPPLLLGQLHLGLLFQAPPKLQRRFESELEASHSSR